MLTFYALKTNTSADTKHILKKMNFQGMMSSHKYNRGCQCYICQYISTVKAYRKVSGRWTSPKEHVCTSPEKGYKSADQCSAVVICIEKCTEHDVNSTFPQLCRKFIILKEIYNTNKLWYELSKMNSSRNSLSHDQNKHCEHTALLICLSYTIN